MNMNKAMAVMAVSLGGLGLWAGSFVNRSVAAQNAEPQAKTDKPAVRDEYQRSLKIYEFKKAANSGPERGMEIYYYKCWYCHNEYTTGAPRLEELQKRGKLESGDPVNNETVAAKIREGSPVMPAYGKTLTDADVKDLVAYLLSGKCCFNSSAPPPNPRYKAR
jgi:cytochrome c5